jgi:DNA (cytosine-5)-methyltransferase 1
MDKLKLLDLFSGIGGFSLGLERTGGFETVAFCEIDPHAATNLPKGVPIYDDVRELRADDIGAVDAICAGFPCQDASIAKIGGAGTDGERTGLFREIIRLASELRPQVIFLENVPELLNRGFGEVLWALAEIGYDAEWDCISASALGFPHKRERLFIVAYPSGSRLSGFKQDYSLFVSAVEAFSEHGDDPSDEWAALVRSEPVLSCGDGVSLAEERRKLKQFGNALLPKIPELLGNAYLESIGWRDAA